MSTSDFDDEFDETADPVDDEPEVDDEAAPASEGGEEGASAVVSDIAEAETLTVSSKEAVRRQLEEEMERFLARGGKITLHVDLTNPTDGKNLPVPATQASADIDLRWEFWDGRQWAAVAELSDDSENFTRSGDVTFRLAGQPVPTTIGGVEKYWIRIRLAAGNYGREARYEPLAAARTNADGQVVEAAAPAAAAGSAGYQLVPADFCPPVIRRLQVDYTVTGGEEPLTTFVTDNDFARVAVVDSAFFPFRAPGDDRPTAYFGFLLPPGRNRFPNRKLSIHAAVAALKSAARSGWRGPKWAAPS